MTNNPQTDTNSAGWSDRYAALLADAQQDIRNVNFEALREAYTQTPGYAPYSSPIAAQELRAALEAKEWARAGYIAAELLDRDFLQLDLHGALAQVFEQAGRTERADWHRAFIAGMINAIMNSGHGLTYDRAFRVVHVREEYEILNILGVRVLERALVEHAGRRYDAFRVNTKQGRPVTIHFDVEVMMGAIQLDNLPNKKT